jgi:GNAT superfamily N-acetyltransferase
MDYVVHVERVVWGPLSASREELEARLSAFPEGFLVAETDGQMIGLCDSIRYSDPSGVSLVAIQRVPEGCHSYHDPNGTALYILSLGVLSRHRGRGIGQMLLEAQIEVARRLGCIAVAGIAHARAHPLYTRAGLGYVQDLPTFHVEWQEIRWPRPTLMRMDL